MTAAAFAKGLLALEGELTPILVQMVKSANTNGLLDNDCDSIGGALASKLELASHEYYESYYRNLAENMNLCDLKERVKGKLHEMLQRDKEFTLEMLSVYPRPDQTTECPDPLPTGAEPDPVPGGAVPPGWPAGALPQ